MAFSISKPHMHFVSSNPHLPFYAFTQHLFCHSQATLRSVHVVLGTGHDVWSVSVWSRLLTMFHALLVHAIDSMCISALRQLRTGQALTNIGRDRLDTRAVNVLDLIL